MNIQESIDRFGTVYFSTDMMKTVIAVETGKIDLDFWFNMLPVHLHPVAIDVLKEVFEPLKKQRELDNDAFKSRLIFMIQEAFVKRLAANKIPPKKLGVQRSWWKELIANGGVLTRE